MYYYRGFIGNKKVDGFLEFSSQERVKDFLLKYNIKIILIKKINKVFARIISQKLSYKQLSDAFRFLGGLLEAGISPYESVKLLSETLEFKELRNVFAKIREGIEQGMTLNEACLFTGKFPAFAVSIIKIGESHSNVSSAVNNLKIYYTYLSKIKTKLISSISYPVILLFSTLCLSAFIIVNVLPRFFDFMSELGLEISGFNLVICRFSSFLRHYGLILILFLTVAVTFLIFYYKANIRSCKSQRILYSIPVLGTQIKLMNSYILLLSIYISLESGANAYESVRELEGLFLGEYLNKSIGKVPEKVFEGEMLWTSLNELDIFGEDSITFIKNGEFTGNLSENVKLGSAFTYDVIIRRFESINSIIGPVIILLVGIMILFIVLSVLRPIFTVIERI